MSRFGMKNVLFVLTISVCLFADQGLARPSENGDAEDYDYFNDEKEYGNTGDNYADPETETDSGEGKPSVDETSAAPPVMHTTAQNLTVKPGSTVYLPCDVDNFEPDYAMLWKANEHLFVDKLKMTTDNRIFKFPNNTIQIKNVRDSDSGNYSCSVSSNPPIEVIHELHVPTPPQIIDLLPRPDHGKGNSKKIMKGDNLVLECKVIGYPKPEIKWTRKALGASGQSKPLRQREDFVIGSPFTIESVDRHDDGTYVCSVSNGIGHDLHREISIHVHYAPEVSIEKETVNSAENIQSELICTVHAFPKAEVEWYHNGVTVTASTHISLTTHKAKHTLTIMKTRKEDFGTYVCKAVNDLGINESVVKLSGIPNQPLLVSSVKDNDGVSQTFEWTVESSSPISEYKIEYRKTEGKSEWMHADPPIVQDPEGNKYTVKHKLSLNPNKYEVILKAMNPYGWSEPSKRHTFSIDLQQLLVVASSSSTSLPVLSGAPESSVPVLSGVPEGSVPVLSGTPEGIKNDVEAPNMTESQTGTAEPSSSAAEDIRPRIFALMSILCVTAFFL